MSLVKSGTIQFSIPKTSRDYYLGGIVHSESGFLEPRMIGNVSYFRLLYGNFPYVEMYEKLLKDYNLYSVILPHLTPKSKYNRASLRLFESNEYGVINAYPRYEKSYEYKSPGSIVTKKVTEDMSEVIIKTHSRIPVPYLFVGYNGENLEDSITSVKYKLDTDGYYLIKFEFSSECIGEIQVASYQKMEEYVGCLDSVYNVAIGDSYTLNKNYLSDIVATETVDEDGWYNKCDIEVHKGSGFYTMTNTESVPINLFIRNYIDADGNELTPSVKSNNLLDQDVSINTLDNDQYKPQNKPRLNLLSGNNFTVGFNELLLGSIQYLDEHNAIVRLNSSDISANPSITDYTIQYQIYEEGQYENLDISQLESGQVAFSNLIEFDDSTDWSDEGYIVLLIDQVRYGISINGCLIPSEYYDVLVNISSYSDLLDWLQLTLGNDRALNSLTEAAKVLTEAWCWNPDDEVVFYGEEGAENREIFIEHLWKQEMFTMDISELIKSVETSFEDFDEESSTADLSWFIGNVVIDEKYKILIIYPSLSENINFFSFNGLSINQCFNEDQDQLCERLEDKKLIDFYSKVKGPAGENIVVSINECRWEGAYVIDIELDSLSESFICYFTKTSEMPDDAIDIRLLGRYSELVESKVYDYELPNGVRIDQMDYFDIFGNYDNYDVNKVISIVLPTEVTFGLKRLDRENIDPDGYRLALKTYSQSDYYPDLLLAPIIDEEDLLKDIYSFVVGNEGSSPSIIGTGNSRYNPCCEKGSYSQAIIRLTPDQLEWNLINDHNRMLYFYSDIIMEDIKYPMFFHYINQIISGRLLQIPADRLIVYYDKDIIGNAVIFNPKLSDKPQLSDIGVQVPSPINMEGYLDITSDNPSEVGSELSEDGAIVLTLNHVELTPNTVYTDNETGVVTGDDEYGFDSNIVIIDDRLSQVVVTLDGINGVYDSSELIGDLAIGNEVSYNGKVYKINSMKIKTYLKVDGKDQWFESTDFDPINDYLDKNQINYLHFNNMYYFYPNLYETKNQQKLFIAQFVCSKVSRAFFEWGKNLKASDASSYQSKISNIVSRLRNCLPYLSSITYNAELDSPNNLLSIHTEVEMQKLTNKVYSINFEINLN